MTRVYDAPPTLAQYILLDTRVQLLLGPIGGGKTTGVLMKLLALCHQQRPNATGQRKTRWAVVRNTRPQLRDSVLKTVFDWLPPDGVRVLWREVDMTLLLDLPQADGTVVEAEIFFRALDDEADARRLLSVEFTGVWFSEFREIPLQLLTDALSRTGRYPSAADGGPSWHGLLGESNFPSRGSDWFHYLEVDPPSYMTLLKQPSGISGDAENLQNLPPDYYTILMEGTTPSWQQAHILCEYPDSLDGKAVYAATFKRAEHVSPTPLRAIAMGSTSPLIMVGVDQGRNPAAVITQMEPRGRLNVLKEVHATNVGMDKFADQYLTPALAAYAGCPILLVIDPAGTQKSQVNDQSPADVLRSRGYRVMGAPTNDPDRRIGAVERLFMQRDGIMIDPACTALIGACAADYRFRTKRNGELEDRPEKLHPVSDLSDALQYVALVAGRDVYGRVTAKLNRRLAPPAPAPSARGWT
jgi:hypothetical protein